MFSKNPDLLPESLVSYELAYTQRLCDNSLTYGLNLYYINGKNIIQVDPAQRKNVNTGHIENWGAEATVAYRFNARWQADANYSWLHMEHPVLAAPEHKLYVGANYQQGRWTAASGVQYIRGLYTSVTQGQEKQETFVLWNLNISYRLCNFASLFVKGENLLAQRYEINAGYPMPKATFMGGVHVNF